MSEISFEKTDVLILCGGLGTRFREVRDDIPKSLAPVKGIPFIDLILNDLVSQGFCRIILGTGHLSSKLENYFQHRLDAEYIISCESKPLGTGGAIKFAENYFCSNQVLILNGDSRITFCIRELLNFHTNHQAEMSILLSSITTGNEYGHVKVNEECRVTSFCEKYTENSSSGINAGVYLINRSLIKNLDPQVKYSLEKDCLPSWVRRHRIFGMVTDMPVYDIGTPERYKNYKEVLLGETQ